MHSHLYLVVLQMSNKHKKPAFFPKQMDNFSFMFILANLLLLLFKSSNATNILSCSQSIVDGRTLVSKDGSFELGFFSPGRPRNYYLGIWYKKVPVKTVVWVANRSNPLNDSCGLLMIDNTGNLVLISNNNVVAWSSNSTRGAQSPVVELLDSGNLVLRDEADSNSGIYLWQSFDYPTDTMLPGMKLGVNLKTGLDRRYTSWKNWDDPSPGDFVWRLLVLHNNAESTLWKGSRIYYRSGPWNGITYSYIPQLMPIFDFNFVRNEEEIYYTSQPKNKSVTFRTVINQTSNRRELYTLDDASQSWSLYSYRQHDNCDQYGLCGHYGNCIITVSPVCQCLKGFNPKSPNKWNSGNWSQGCIRTNSLNCKSGGDNFMKYAGIKLPDTTNSWLNESMNLKECRAKCLQNCSCTAYASYDIRKGGSGCTLWFNDLIDIREITFGGQELYIRMSASDFAEPVDLKNESHKKLVIIMPTIAVVFGILVVSCYLCKRKIREKYLFGENCEASEEDLDLPLFDLATISRATNKFSLSNKLGQGGFGPVFKGALPDGQEIAVKRLSSNSGQGLTEFKNEVKFIAKLQHRNLVKLLGCCIEGIERLLIYEYMPNKSLDYFIFDQTRGKLLDWSNRFNIICATARGLLYLHQDSRLRIIHRDVKASNVLLDIEMTPKISDFGMAKTFGGEQTGGNTSRVAGTFGYMAPEYAIDGLFSVKSDVFSFGILMLEIISGKKNRGVYHPDRRHNLIGYAWRLWKVGNFLELVEPFLRDSCQIMEIGRCIHISLLCVQNNAEDRPNMAAVVLMLGSETELPEPKKPGFLIDSDSLEAESSSSKRIASSINEISLSMLEAR